MTVYKHIGDAPVWNGGHVKNRSYQERELVSVAARTCPFTSSLEGKGSGCAGPTCAMFCWLQGQYHEDDMAEYTSGYNEYEETHLQPKEGALRWKMRGTCGLNSNPVGISAGPTWEIEFARTKSESVAKEVPVT